MGNRLDATYTNLNPGKYTFHVIGSNNDGLWNKQGRKLHITILPPWYSTWWFRFSIIFLITGSIYKSVQLRIRILRLRQKGLELAVKERTSQLLGSNMLIEEQKEELQAAVEVLQKTQDQLVHSEKMASLCTLTAGIAHEIINPLNFIEGGRFALEQDLKDEDNLIYKREQPFLDAIKTGIDRILNIVNSLDRFSTTANRKQRKCAIHHILDDSLTMLQDHLHSNTSIHKK